LRRELHAEWTKLRTLTATPWLVLAIVAVTVGMSAAVSAAVSCSSAGCGHDAGKLSLAGIQLSQAAVAMLAVLAVSGEYSTGMIRTTLTAMPRRTAVLAAKAAVLAGIALAAGVVAVAASLLAGRLILPSSGFTPAHGYPLLSLADGAMLRAAVGSVLYLALVALLSLGMAAAVRDSAVAMGAVLCLLYLFPIVALMLGDPDWHRQLAQISPDAGLAIQATADLGELPVRPWAGLGVLAAWAAAALTGGGLLLRLRDA